MSKYIEHPWFVDALIEDIEYYLAYAGSCLKTLKKAVKEIQEGNKKNE